MARRRRQAQDPAFPAFGFRVTGIPSLGPYRTYEECTDEELNDLLSGLKTSHRDRDQYEMFEKLGTKLNLTLVNNAQEYLEDVSVELLIPESDALLIAPKVFRPPPKFDSMGHMIPDFDFAPSRYPDVKRGPLGTRVWSEVGTLRHGIPQQVFGDALRVLIGEALLDEDIEVKYWVRAKQLPHPKVGILNMRVTR